MLPRQNEARIISLPCTWASPPMYAGDDALGHIPFPGTIDAAHRDQHAFVSRNAAAPGQNHLGCGVNVNHGWLSRSPTQRYVQRAAALSTAVDL